MVFTLNRINNQIPKKVISINSSINSNNLKDSIGSTGITTIANVNTLSFNGTIIPVNANQINTTQVLSLGTVEPSKVITTNSNNNIININNLSCNALIVNNQNITADMYNISSSDDINNSYLSNINDGSATSSNSLTTNINNSINNINTLSLKTIKLNNVNISNTNNSTITIKNSDNLLPDIHAINTGFTSLLSTYRYMVTSAHGNAFDNFNNYYWSAVCWSPELSIFVSVSNGYSNAIRGVYSVMTSKDGLTWNIQSAFDLKYEDVIWISKLKLFVAVSSTGTNNQIMTSPDGINWTLRTTPTSNVPFKSMVWSNELNLCVIVNRNNNMILISNDCINWRLTNASLPVGLLQITWSPELSLFVAITNTSYNSEYKIFVSNDGTSWNYITYSLTGTQFRSICWSDYWKMFVIATNNKMLYSYDGFNWFNSISIQYPVTLIWINELRLFYGYDETGYIVYSKTGITDWTAFQADASSYSYPGKIVWSPELGIIITSMRQGSATTTSGKRLMIIKTNYIGKKPSFIANSNILYQDRNNKYYGFNTMQPNRPVEINTNSGNALKFTYSGSPTKTTTFDVLLNGQLNLTTSSFNIYTDSSSYGLKLNNILVTNTASILNTISLVTNGVAKELCPLITDSNNNISNINLLSCNSLIINGSNYDSSLNNSYFKNTTIGLAKASKAMITDNNNNIMDINNLSCNNIKINNDSIIVRPNNVNVIHNLTNYNNQINKPDIGIYYNLLNNLKTVILPSGGNYNAILWVSELQMFIAGINGGTYKIMTSPDGINWTNSQSFLGITANQSAICWSPELKILVATNSNITNNRIYISTNGLDWKPQYNNTLNSNYVSICWSPELSLFVMVSSSGEILSSSSGYNWTSSYVNGSISFTKVIWANKLNLFIAISSSQSYPLFISSNGVEWIDITGLNLKGLSSGFRSIAWSEELNMTIVFNNTTDANYYYSYDGYNWCQGLLPFNTNTMIEIEWISDLNLFVATPNQPYPIRYSYDGLNWFSTSSTYSASYRIAWSTDLKKLLMLTYSTTAYLSNTLLPTNSLNTVVSQSNNLIINKTNGNMGIGLNPSYQLELSTDSAAKATSSSWTIGSDIRLKEEIELADLDICYNNFKNINLVKYKWKDEIYNDDSINDRSQLGWIAQDVELLFPKSVTIINKFGLDNCRQLNSDQLLSTLYGTVQKLINNYENQDSDINNLDDDLTNIDNFINTLVIT